MVRPTAQFMEVQATLESVLVNAEIMAELTARFLTAWRQTSGWKAQSCFPAEFLLDVGGILRIAMLAQAGLLPTLGLYEVPAEDLLARLTNRLA